MTIADDLAEIASIGPFYDVNTHENHSLCLAATAAPVDLSMIRRNGSTAPFERGRIIVAITPVTYWPPLPRHHRCPVLV